MVGFIHLEMVATSVADLSLWSVSSNSVSLGTSWLASWVHFQHHWWHFVGSMVLFRAYGIALEICENCKRTLSIVIRNFKRRDEVLVQRWPMSQHLHRCALHLCSLWQQQEVAGKVLTWHSVCTMLTLYAIMVFNTAFLCLFTFHLFTNGTIYNLCLCTF